LIDRDRLARAAARSGHVAVYVVGEHGGNQIRIGTAANPYDVFRTAQQWNWRQIDVHGVLWTPGKLFAEKIKKRAEDELGPYHLRGAWFDLDPQMVISTIVSCAIEEKAELFNDKERYQRLQDDIARAIEKRATLKRATARPVAEVLPFRRR
jgi:hypothetical protein